MEFDQKFEYELVDFAPDFGKDTNNIVPISYHVTDRDRVLIKWNSIYLGRTTFMETLLGLHSSYNGKILINNKNINELSRNEKSLFRRDSSIIFQKPALISNLNVFENIALPLRYHHNTNSGKSIKEMVEETIEEFKLEKLVKKMPESLSQNQAKIVSFARTLIKDSKLLLLDEPTSGLDGYGFDIFIEVALEKIVKNKELKLIILTSNSKIIDLLSVNKELVVEDFIDNR